MKELELSGTSKILAVLAVRNCPDGHKGFDRLRTANKLMDKLEADLPKDKPLTKDEEKQMFKVNLENVEYKLLKDCIEVMPWNGNIAKQALELLDDIEGAVEK